MRLDLPRLLDGVFFAIDDRCPHAGGSLARGALQGDTVRCSMHLWAFCVRDGRYLDQDRPEANVASHFVRIVDGWVQVALRPTDSV